MFDTIDWQFKSDKKAITIHNGKVEGSKYKAVRLVTEVNAPSRSILAALGDSTKCEPWISVCHSARLVETINEHEWIGYAVIKLPVPLISKRDSVFKSIVRIDEQSGVIERLQLSVADMLPENKKYVRMSSQSKFIIEPLSANRSKVTWFVHPELGGGISPSMVNGRSYKSNRKDLLALIKYVTD